MNEPFVLYVESEFSNDYSVNKILIIAFSTDGGFLHV